jgi:uncharacterized protein YukE
MNDGDLYRVSWTGQAEAAGFVQTAIGSIQTELDGINSETSALLSRWDDSESQAAYQARQQKWTGAANDIVMALEKFKASLNTSADLSSAKEKENAGRMAGG